MTSFVDDDGNYLDYSGSDIGITKQVANFFDFKIKGDVSANLTIPNNSQNRKALGYYGAQQIDSPAFSKVPFNMVKDGNTISRGFIVIKDSDDEDINVFYISGNTNWFQNFQFNLKEIDFDDKYTVSGNSWDSRKASTDGIIFPVVDWFAKGQKRGDGFAIAANATQEDLPVFTEIHPALYLHSLVDEMGRYGGVTIGGDLITDALFKKIVLTADGPDIYWPDWAVEQSDITVESEGGVYNTASDPQLIRFSKLIDGSVNGFDPSAGNYSLTATRTATYRFDLDMQFNTSVALWQVDFYINGVFTLFIMNTTLTGFDSKFVTFYYSLNKGDYVQFYVSKTTGGGNYRLTLANNRTSLRMQIAKPLGYQINYTAYLSGSAIVKIPPMGICPDMKAIDLIKFLAVYFSCIVSYDEYSNTIRINQLKNFRKEDAEDWSEYFVSCGPDYQTGAAANNYIQGAEGPEDQIEAYNSQSSLRYGGGNIQTSFDTKEEREVYELPFSGSWDQPNGTDLRWFLPYIKFYDIEFGESVAYSGVVNSGGLARFTATFQDNIMTNEIMFIKSNDGNYTGYGVLNDSTTSLTNPTFKGIDFLLNDTGTLVRCTVSKVSGPPRMLLCYPGTTITDYGGPSSFDMASTASSTAAVVHFDKPKIGFPADAVKETLAIDSINNNNSISELNYGVVKNVFKNPKVNAYFTLPLAVFQRFEFDTYIRIETKDLTGYFIAQKIENYRDALTPIKVELLYAD